VKRTQRRAGGKPAVGVVAAVPPPVLPAIVSEAQERAAPGWAERAYRAIVTVARNQLLVHVDDVLAFFCEPPEHPNPWGSVWQRAIRDGVITRTGMLRESCDRRKHRHQYPVYQPEKCGV
jgi:hypothetical protein